MLIVGAGEPAPTNQLRQAAAGRPTSALDVRPHIREVERRTEIHRTRRQTTGVATVDQIAGAGRDGRDIGLADLRVLTTRGVDVRDVRRTAALATRREGCSGAAGRTDCGSEATGCRDAAGTPAMDVLAVLPDAAGVGLSSVTVVGVRDGDDADIQPGVRECQRAEAQEPEQEGERHERLHGVLFESGRHDRSPFSLSGLVLR